MSSQAQDLEYQYLCIIFGLYLCIWRGIWCWTAKHFLKKNPVCKKNEVCLLTGSDIIVVKSPQN